MVSLFASSSSSSKAGKDKTGGTNSVAVSGGAKKRPWPPLADGEELAAASAKRLPAAESDHEEEGGGPPVEVEEVVPSASEAKDAAAAAGDGGAGSYLSGSSWGELGLAPWVLKACKAMGFKRPTPVQARCIPAVLAGRDVMGCAETGSGKTAAFALPMLHRLSEDPYGIFGLVLTPTRELAIQIAEQFQALGAPMGLRIAVVIGGVSMVEQAVALAKRPHVVVATPGRLWDHLRGPSPPALGKARFLVLDEADRLFCDGFEAHLGVILSAMTAPRRQTLLFSATMTASLEELKALTRVQPVLFDLTRSRALPASLQQQYLFMPAQVKTCYLVELLQKAMLRKGGEGDGVSGSGGPKSSAMVFVGTCQRCQEITEVLLEAGLPAVCLHSVMSQKRRLAALGKFKSSLVRVLVSTDVASRGLDIPEVDLVVNFDLPRVPADYVHRVGRTARAGRFGRAVSLATQFDVQLVQGIEAHTQSKMELCPDVKEEEVVKLLNPVAKATRAAKLRLMELGFDEQVQEHARRKKADKKKKKKKKLKRKQQQAKARGKPAGGGVAPATAKR